MGVEIKTNEIQFFTVAVNGTADFVVGIPERLDEPDQTDPADTRQAMHGIVRGRIAEFAIRQQNWPDQEDIDGAHINDLDDSHTVARYLQLADTLERDSVGAIVHMTSARNTREHMAPNRDDATHLVAIS